MLGARVVGVHELVHARNALLLAAAGLGELHLALEVSVAKHLLDNAGLGDLLEEVLAELEARAKGAHLGLERLLGLRVKVRVVNECVDKDPQVVAHKEWLDGHTLVLLLNDGLQVLN